MRYLVILLIASSAGYAYGFHDAHVHERNVVERAVDRLRDANQDKFNADADKQLDKVEQH